jgi:hypothetical protein
MDAKPMIGTRREWTNPAKGLGLVARQKGIRRGQFLGGREEYVAPDGAFDFVLLIFYRDFAPSGAGGYGPKPCRGATPGY